jgi:Ca2+-binding RTX toxin-like protein
MANVINILAPFPLAGPWSVYDIMLSGTAVQQQSPTHFVLLTQANGGTVTVDFTGTGFTYDSNGRANGGSFTKFVIINNGVPSISFNYSPPIGITALNAGLTVFQNTENTGPLDALFGAQPTSHNGTSAGESLFGLDGVDIFYGKGGSDVLSGRGGNDIYNLVAPGSTIVEAANGGVDSVNSTVSYTLAANVERLNLTGSAAINGAGNALANLINGANNSASNVLYGFGGDDTYTVGLGDVVVEAANSGVDTVQSAVSHTLSANVENLTLTGSAVINGAGNALANTLNGQGNSKANVLYGFAGDDVYVVGAGDTVVEAANGGTDTVLSNANHTLGANVENLYLTGSAAINGAGNAGGNTINGEQNTAANVLYGFGGNDVYIVGAGDTVVEAQNGGTDLMRSSTVGFTLANFVENALLTGTANIFAVGNSGDNTITGNSGSNIINGGYGNDTLKGGAGSDFFTFNTQLDAASNVDIITDYNVAEDSFRVSSTYNGIGPAGVLDAQSFRIGIAAADATDRILYDPASGFIQYDPDGTGIFSAILFARVTPGLAITNEEFLIF